MIINNKEFDDNRTHIMGIINVTPDSFSDGGSYASIDDILFRTEQMIDEGAAIIDVGGESTRPGHVKITDEEEISRVAPAIEAITKRFDITVSIDTYKSAVAKAALDAGAHTVNDIWGLQYDSKLAKVIKDYDASVVITHNKDNSDYADFAIDYINETAKLCEIAVSSGIDKGKIIIDPGVGFAKSTEQNLIVLNTLTEFSKIGFPVLLGTSRKSVIGNTLNLPVNDRLEGTLATTALAVINDVRFVRVHDIKENARVIKMLEAVKNA